MDTDRGAVSALYKRIAIRSALLIGGAAFIWFGLPRLLSMLMPFVIALFVAMILNPFVNQVRERIGLSRGIIALILDLCFFLVIASLVTLLIFTIASEAISLATSIQSNWDVIMAGLDGIEENLSPLMEFLPDTFMDVVANFQDGFFEWLQTVSSRMLGSAVSLTTSLTTRTGNFVINFIIAILAVYFMIADYEKIAAGTRRHAGKGIYSQLAMLKSAIGSALGGYIRAQILLALFAFAVMFVAFTIYGQKYALLIALFLGMIDFLPVVGTIAVLTPWGLFELVMGDFRKGIFLLVLGVGFFLARKVVEPQIVGSQTGLHPLAALMSTYVGLKFSGVWGAILGPMVLMLAISIVKSGLFDSTLADFKLLVNHLGGLLKTTE